jgi:ABC-type lipoprotein export system ATPase subunit
VNDEMLVETLRVPDPDDARSSRQEDEHDIDADLIARVAREDRQALTDLYERRKTQLMRYLLGFTADYSLAEEILQDTFLAVWKNACGFQGAARGQVWLWGIARRRRVDELLETVGLAHVANRKLKAFSGGMKRRVGVAQALLNDPQLLIVDEPTAGLDPEERIRFRNLLADLAGDRTMLLSTHIVEDVAQMCPRLAVLTTGRVAFHGATGELIQPAQGHVWTVTSSGPKPEGDLTIVSTLHLGSGIQYRVVGSPPIGSSAIPAEPSLEDGYIWLMREQRAPLAMTAS